MSAALLLTTALGCGALSTPAESRNSQAQSETSQPSPSLADIADQLAPLTRQLSASVRRPAGIADVEYAQLRARVEFRVDIAGHVLSAAIAQPSGNTLFDGALLEAFDSFRVGRNRLEFESVTDETLLNAILRDGAVIEIRGR